MRINVIHKPNERPVIVYKDSELMKVLNTWLKPTCRIMDCDEPAMVGNICHDHFWELSE